MRVRCTTGPVATANRRDGANPKSKATEPTRMVVLCSLGTKSVAGNSAESGYHGSTNYTSQKTLRTPEFVENKAWRG